AGSRATLPERRRSPYASGFPVPQSLTEGGARAREPGLDRAHRAAQDLRGLRLRQPFQIEQNDRAAIFREGHERALDVLRRRLAQPIELDVVALTPDVLRDGQRWGGRVEPARDGVVTLAPVVAHERVAQDPEEPGLEIGPRRELRGRVERTCVCLLDEILGIAFI